MRTHKRTDFHIEERYQRESKMLRAEQKVLHNRIESMKFMFKSIIDATNREIEAHGSSLYLSDVIMLSKSGIQKGGFNGNRHEGTDTGIPGAEDKEHELG